MKTAMQGILLASEDHVVADMLPLKWVAIACRMGASRRRERFWGLQDFMPEELACWMEEVGLSDPRCLHAAGGWLIMSATREGGAPGPAPQRSRPAGSHPGA